MVDSPGGPPVEPPNIDKLYELVLRVELFGSEVVGELSRSWLGHWYAVQGSEVDSERLNALNEALYHIRVAMREELIEMSDEELASTRAY